VTLLRLDKHQAGVPAGELCPALMRNLDGDLHGLRDQLVVVGTLGRSALGLHGHEVRLFKVALAAGSHDVFPTSLTAVKTRNNVVKRQRSLDVAFVLSTVLTLVVVTQQHVLTAELDSTSYLDVLAQQQHGRNLQRSRRAVNFPVLVCCKDFRVLKELKLDSSFPLKCAQGHNAQGQTVRVKDQSVRHWGTVS